MKVDFSAGERHECGYASCDWRESWTSERWPLVSRLFRKSVWGQRRRRHLDIGAWRKRHIGYWCIDFGTGVPWETLWDSGNSLVADRCQFIIQVIWICLMINHCWRQVIVRRWRYLMKLLGKVDFWSIRGNKENINYYTKDTNDILIF